MRRSRRKFRVIRWFVNPFCVSNSFVIRASCMTNCCRLKSKIPFTDGLLFSPCIIWKVHLKIRYISLLILTILRLKKWCLTVEFQTYIKLQFFIIVWIWFHFKWTYLLIERISCKFHQTRYKHRNTYFYGFFHFQNLNFWFTS